MASASTGGDDPLVQPLDRQHPTQPHPHQNNKPRSRDTLNTADTILIIGDIVARLLLPPLNLPNTTLPILTSQQPLPTTRN